MDVKELLALQEAYNQVYEPQELSEEVEISTEYFYEMGLNEDGINFVIEKLGDDEFSQWVYDIAEEYTLTEARVGGARVEPVTKTGKQIGSLKGGAKTSAIRSRQKEKAARREAEASAANPSGMTAALRSQAAQSAASKQKPKASTPAQTKKGIGGLIGAAVQRAKQDTELLVKSIQTARAAGRPAEKIVAQAAGTAAGAVHGAAKAVHRSGQQFGKSEVGQKIKTGLGKTAKAAAGAAGAGVGSLVAGRSPAAAAGRAAGTFVRKLTREDIYDIVLSHLLDEGYAETVDAAEKIMVNMSEEWRDEIVDEVLDEALTGYR